MPQLNDDMGADSLVPERFWGAEIVARVTLAL
jgi:hypothetical protein